jgi:hypothetical protein
MKPTNDPSDTVLDELHATRRRLLAQHGGVKGLAAFLRKEEARCGATVVESGAAEKVERRPRRAVKD